MATRVFMALLGFGLLTPHPVSAKPAVTQHNIQPLMMLRCTVCHGPRKQEGKLDLRTRESMLRGGKSGPAIVPGKSGESLVLKKIHDGEMPPRRKVVQASVKPMEPSEIALLTKWIELGAPVGEAPKPKPYPIKKADLEFWAFQKPQRPAVPAICRCLPICRSTALSGSSKEKLNFKPWIVNLSRPELD